MENPVESKEEKPLIEMVEAAVASARQSGVEVEGVNWRVFPKSFWVVAGMLGSGHSDFLATAGGLQRPARGQVRLFGCETFTIEEKLLVEQRRRIGIVFANGGRLFNWLTVAQNVALPVRYHQNWTETAAEDSVREILELTGLIAEAHELPGALGQPVQLRAALARALILKPEILLLDNPLRGMDVRDQQWTLDFLTTLSEGSEYLCGEPLTLVVTADHIEPWRNVARQFALLTGKRWREIGGRAELEANGTGSPREDWTENN